MAFIPTEYKSKLNVLRGACVFSARPYKSTGAWVEFGALDGCKITENLAVATEETQNIQDIDALNDQTATIECARFEKLDETLREILRNGLDLVTNIPGTPVVGATQQLASGDWAFLNFIPLLYKNADGTVPTNITATGSVDGVLVEGTDFIVTFVDGQGYGIQIIDSVTVTTEEQDIDLTMDYTPIASREITSGGITVLPVFELKIDNKYAEDKNVTWIFYYCQLGTGDETEFKKYNEDDTRISSPTTFNAKLDSTRTPGDQLYKFIDGRSMG